MNRSTVESDSARSGSSVITRFTRPETGRLRRNNFYLWLFGSMHARRLMVHLQILLTLVGTWFLVLTCVVSNFEPPPIPGIDGYDAFWHPGRPDMERIDSLRITVPGEPYKPYKYMAQNIVNFIAFFYLISVALSFYGVHLAERAWSNRSPPCYINPAIYLLPFLASMASFFVPIFLWTMRIWRTADIHYRNLPNTSLVFIDSIRFVLVPTLVIWAMYFYLLYGVSLAFVYVWRRARSSRRIGGKWHQSFTRKVRRTLLKRKKVDSKTDKESRERGFWSQCVRRNNRRRNDEESSFSNMDDESFENSLALSSDFEPEQTLPLPTTTRSGWCVRHLETVDEERSADGQSRDSDRVHEVVERVEESIFVFGTGSSV